MPGYSPSHSESESERQPQQRYEDNHAEYVIPEVSSNVDQVNQDTSDVRRSGRSSRRDRVFSRRHSSYVLARMGCQRMTTVVWRYSDNVVVETLSWIILALFIWCLLYLIIGGGVGAKGQLLRLLVLVISAYLMGRATEKLFQLPGLLGMLVTGFILRNVDFYYPAQGEYKKFTSALKQMATSVAMLKAGMSLVPDAIYAALHGNHGLRLAGLGIIPSFLEAMVTSVILFFVFRYPANWAVLIGFLLCPNSPSVIVPAMQKLMDAGYGEEHLGSLVNGAAGLDVAISVSIFDICISTLYDDSALDQKKFILVGCLDMFVDTFAGLFFGLTAGLLPVQDNDFAVWKRAVAIVTTGMIAIVAGNDNDYLGTGPLCCIITGFLASMLWKIQRPLSCKYSVADILQGSWVVLCPILFSYMGAEAELRNIASNKILWMPVIVFITIVVRLVGVALVLIGSQLNWKERLFIGIIFQGKATNQAALAPNLLHAVWITHLTQDNFFAAEAVTMAVLSILICTPLAHLGAKLGGPCLLTERRDTQSTNRSSGPSVGRTGAPNAQG